MTDHPTRGDYLLAAGLGAAWPLTLWIVWLLTS